MHYTKQKVFLACWHNQQHISDHFFFVLVILQLIHEEKVTGVVSMNEDYELWLFANGKNVSLLQRTS